MSDYPCPDCGHPMTCDTVDNGVGEEPCGPYGCERCHYVVPEPCLGCGFTDQHSLKCPMILNAGTDDYMCPNCTTPWKCNGPHEPAGTQHIKDPTRTWTIPDDLEGGGHVEVGCIDACPACADDTRAYEQHLVLRRRLTWQWCLAQNLAAAGSLQRMWDLREEYEHAKYEQAESRYCHPDPWQPNLDGWAAP